MKTPLPRRSSPVHRSAATLGGFALLALLITCGCNHIDAGVSDYSRAGAPASKSTDNTTKSVPFSDGKYVIPPKADDATYIHKGDTISINLAHGFIKDFSEADWFHRVIDPQLKRKRGEVAVVARVKEISNKGPDFDFTSSGHTGGRLIYYSDGVHVNAHLNFSFLPVYGPINYDGYPLAISFYILELDKNQSASMKSLLNTLTAVGGKAYPPSAPVLSVLDKIGSSLVSQQKDDVDLAYHFYLQPYSATSDNTLGQPLLRTGNYALVKQDFVHSEEVRAGVPFSWNVTIDPSNGLLSKTVTGTSQASKPVPFTGATYLTFQINKGQKADNLNQAERFAQFSNFLDSIKGTEFMDFTTIGTQLTGMLARDENDSRAKNLFTELSEKYPKNGVTDTADLKARRTSLLGELEKYIFDENAKDSRYYLRTADKNALLERIGALYLPSRASRLTRDEFKKLEQ
jgi:hypothetical protein